MHSEILQAKWQDYLFLTQEMHKFLVKNDVDLFQGLLNQRIALQEEIQVLSAADGEYNTSVEGQTVIKQIHLADQAMQHQFSRIHNFAKKQRAVSQAYDGGENFGGRFINKNT
jgi:hypothetical protein